MKIKVSDIKKIIREEIERHSMNELQLADLDTGRRTEDDDEAYVKPRFSEPGNPRLPKERGFSSFKEEMTAEEAADAPSVLEHSILKILESLGGILMHSTKDIMVYSFPSENIAEQAFRSMRSYIKKKKFSAKIEGENLFIGFNPNETFAFLPQISLPADFE